MIVLAGDRTILLKLFSGQLDPSTDGREIESYRDLPNAEVVAVFSRASDRQIPDFVVVDMPNLHEFFAWSSTYLPHWSPLTAGMRVVERRRVDEFLPPRNLCLPRRLTRGLLCLSLGELFYEWQSNKIQTRPTVLSLRSTFGYVAASAMMASYTCASDLISKWFRAQHLLQVHPRRLNPKTIKTVWDPIFSMLENGANTTDPGKVVTHLAASVGKKQQELFNSDWVLENPERRERVVVELEEFVSNSSLSEPSSCFQAATLATRMSTRPLSHFSVLSGMTKSEPRCLLWYSFLSGLCTSDPADPTAEALLFRMERDLERETNSTGDIQLDELEAVIRPDGSIPDGIGIGARFVSVELDPGIVASFRLIRDTPQAPTADIPLDDAQQFKELLERMKEVFDRVSNARPTKKGSSPKRKTKKSRKGQR